MKRIWKKKTSAMSPCDEGCVTGRHLKWGPLSRNEDSEITQHVREKNGNKRGGMNETSTYVTTNLELLVCSTTSFYIFFIHNSDIIKTNDGC